MIKDIVSKQEYDVWVKMLKALVPNGRTHRLSVFIAGILQYTYAVAMEKKSKPAQAYADLVNLIDEDYEGESLVELEPYLIELFNDAGVKYERANSRGDSYSIVENAIKEFVAWENMPWE